MIGAHECLARQYRQWVATLPSGAMPVGVHDGGDLPELCRDQAERVFGHTRNVDLDVEHSGRTQLGDDSPRQDVQILEALEDAREHAGIGVSDNAKT